MWEKQLCRHQGQCRRRGEGAPCAGAELPLQPVIKTTVRQAVPLQPMKVHSGADLHLQPMVDPTPEQVVAWRRLWPSGEPELEQAPGRACGPMERGAYAGAVLLAGLVTAWRGAPAGAACSWRTAPHGKDPHWSSLWRAAAHGRTHIAEGRQRQLVMNWLQPPFPVPLRCSGGGGREFESEVKPGKKKGVEEGLLRFSFYFVMVLPWWFWLIILTDNKLNKSSLFFSVGIWWVISSCPYLDPWAFCNIFSPLSSWGKGAMGSFGGHLASSHG